MAFDKLSTLTKRELEILHWLCMGVDYRGIADRGSISYNTVKVHIGNVYKKLDLDYIESRTVRLQTLVEIYCPLVRQSYATLPKPAPDEDEEEEPAAISARILDMVEADERDLVRRPPQEVVTIDPPPVRILPPAPPPARPFRAMLIGVLGGALLMACLGGVGFLLWQQFSPPPPLPTQSALHTQAPAPTSAPGQPGATIAVQTVVVVVTATPPPATPEPAATLPPTTEPDTPNAAVLEVGEWWKTNDVWIKVSEALLNESGSVIITLDMWNKTGSSLLFEWSTARNFSLKDNTGHVYPRYRGDEVNNEVFNAGESKSLLSYGGLPYTAVFTDQYLFDPSVTDLYFTVTDLSRIAQAQFHIKVPK